MIQIIGNDCPALLAKNTAGGRKVLQGKGNRR